MDGMSSSSFLASHTYFNISLVFLLRSCGPSSTPHTTFSEQEIDDDEVNQEADSSDFSVSLNEVVSWLFGSEARSEEEKTDDSVFSFWEPRDDCQDIIHTDIGGAVTSASLVKIVVGAVLSFSLMVVLFRLVWRKCRFWVRKEPADTAIKPKEQENNREKNEVEASGVGNITLDQREVSLTSGMPVGSRSNMPTVIPLVKVTHSLKSSHFVSQPDISQFVKYTVDHVSAQLDWMLGLASADQSSSATQSMSATTNSLLTPRLQRKGGIRRPRWRTLTNLPLEATDTALDDKAMMRMWQKVEDMERRMNWTQMYVGDLDINAVQDYRLSAILQFYQQACPVRVEQWSASCLIVNYVLTLLEQELISGTSDSTPLKVLELRSFGSASNETCITRANRFNVLLVMQLSHCSEMTVYNCGVCDDIPAGKLVLGVKENYGGASPLVHKDRIGDCFGSFLSVREAVKASQRLLSNAMDRLKLRAKPLLDRLSFITHLSQYDDLLLCIDTKMLNNLGLGLSQITIHLTPALRVSSEETNPLPPLYAVPPWNIAPTDSSDGVRSRIQSRIMRSHNQGVPSDLLWQLNCSELTKSFMSSAKRKLMSAGVSGCQVMCQQILRAVFSRSGKDTLLTTGELHPHVLDSVIFFLLLESPASSWSFHCLPDRFSDCIHFLRSAVQSTWMPGFMVHNPHLVKQMPALQLLPQLTSPRQENILANVGPDAAENILSFMDSRLQETGLKRCVKEDYSTEMWEYEFFIFG